MTTATTKTIHEALKVSWRSLIEPKINENGIKMMLTNVLTAEAAPARNLEGSSSCKERTKIISLTNMLITNTIWTATTT